MQPSQTESFGDSEMRLAEMARLTGAPTRAVKQKRKLTPVSDLLDASGVFLGVGKGEARGFGPLDLILLADGVGLLKIWQIALGRAGSDFDAPFCLRSQNVLFSCRSGTRSTARHGGHSLY